MFLSKSGITFFLRKSVLYFCKKDSTEKWGHIVCQIETHAGGGIYIFYKIFSNITQFRLKTFQGILVKFVFGHTGGTYSNIFYQNLTLLNTNFGATTPPPAVSCTNNKENTI